MKKKNYVSKAVMLGALLAPIGMPTVSVLADSFYQNQTSAHAADITNSEYQSTAVRWPTIRDSMGRYLVGNLSSDWDFY